MCRRLHALALLAFGLLLGHVDLTAQIRVVTTIPDLADLAEWIGGDAVRAESLTKGHEDFHMVNPRPSLLVKMRRADVFIELGLDAEHSWVPALMRNARNRKIHPGGNGYAQGEGFCNASLGVAALQVPQTLSRAAGPDIHPQGNPHYNLDPERMRIAARNVRNVLVRVRPDLRERFENGHARWEAELNRRLATWRETLAPFAAARFIEYHNAWVYFADAFDLRIVGQLEPRPGLAPTPSHLGRMLDAARTEGVGLIVARPQNAHIAERVAKDAGAKVAVLQLCSACEGETHGWFDYMDHVVDTFAAHLRKHRAATRPTEPAAAEASTEDGRPAGAGGR